MNKILSVLLVLLLTSCFGKTSRDLPSDDEAIRNFLEHRATLEQIKDLVRSDPNYSTNERLEELLEESNCEDVVNHNDVVLVTYFLGGMILSSSELFYIHMDTYHPNYGDTIPMHLNLRDQVYKDKLQVSKLKNLGGGWYLLLLVE